MSYEVLNALREIVAEKQLSKEFLLEVLKLGLRSAAKKHFGGDENIEVNVEQNTGDVKIFILKSVVEEVNEPKLEIGLEKARKLNPEVKVGDRVKEEVRFERFGRNAIQTAKQVLIQHICEAEREKIYEEYRDKIGEIVTGKVQQIDRGEIIVNLGRTEAKVPIREQIRRERYRQGNTIRAYIMDVLKTTKGSQITLSRTHPGFLERLFQIEVPEVYEGIVKIKAVAREAGERSKIAVASNDEKVDPVGACVGMKGMRVQSIVRELNNERIDIISWSSDPATFISRAIAPAKVVDVVIDQDQHRLLVVVPDDQLSLAIGRSGQNARLAAKLTRWQVDLISESEYRKALKVKEETEVAIESLPGVGQKLAQKLAETGAASVRDLMDVKVEDLTSIPGIGRKRAEKLLRAAEEMIGRIKGEYSVEGHSLSKTE